MLQKTDSCSEGALLPSAPVSVSGAISKSKTKRAQWRIVMRNPGPREGDDIIYAVQERVFFIFWCDLGGSCSLEGSKSYLERIKQNRNAELQEAQRRKNNKNKVVFETD